MARRTKRVKKHVKRGVAEALKSAGLALGLLVLVGGAWVSLASFLPTGLWRNVAIVAVGAGFAGAYVYLLVSRIRDIYRGRNLLPVELGLALLNLAGLLAAFGAVYAVLGVNDTTSTPERVTHAYADAAYFSVVTFTTLGYGDLQPRGVARILACLEALIGYLVLGVLASTAADLVQPDDERGGGGRRQELTPGGQASGRFFASVAERGYFSLVGRALPTSPVASSASRSGTIDLQPAGGTR